MSYQSKEEIKNEILKRSVANKIEEGETVVLSGDDILHVRSAEDYFRLWNLFLEKEETEFKKLFGYGEKEITEIGFKNFIDAMDWHKDEDVSKWRTDTFNIVICPECKKDFGIYQKMGLCGKCLKDFDETKIGALMNVVSMHSLYLPAIINESMYLMPELRNDFKKGK